MDTAVAPTGASTAAVTHFDVLVIGAGISGIDAAYHLKTYMPERSFCVLESKDDFGGTWKTHTYPGIRSDSDLYTFGYSWKPWVGAPIATAPERSIAALSTSVILTSLPAQRLASKAAPHAAMPPPTIRMSVSCSTISGSPNVPAIVVSSPGSAAPTVKDHACAARLS